MRYNFLPVAALAGVVYSQSLTELLSSTDELSSLADLIGDAPEIAASLADATNITLLAPSNQAIEALLSGPLADAVTSTPGLLQAVLQYHVLAGRYEIDDIPNDAIVVPTLLTDEDYTSLPDGQVVITSKSNGVIAFVSGLLSNTSTETYVSKVRYDDLILHFVS